MLKKLFLIAILNMLTLGSLTSCSNVEKLQPLTPSANILAYGDSLTYGTGTSRENSYPAQLALMTGYNVINAGIPGEISSKGLMRLPSLIKQYQPELIILCHGANDILKKMDLEKAKDNIQKMIELAKQNNSQIVLIAVPEFDLFLDSSPIYKTLAEHNNIPIENEILGKIISDGTLKSDHIHPNNNGYRLLAEKIALLLQQTGAIRSN